MPLSSIQRRILVADDDREVRLGVAELLDDLGLEILHAATGTEAVELVRGTRIDAALLDMHMPGYTGMQAIPLLRGFNKTLPCIVYSGRWSLDLEQEVLSAGAFACLKKPVEPVVLRRIVCIALGLPPDLSHRDN
ncbi:MAG: response regulator [Planctomycetes bacterium]|nr:response regulator [Planctomycetota bacterium]